jgi:two-component system CheB/CheR fusion protein
MSHELRNPLNVIVGYSDLLTRTKEIAGSPQLFMMTDAIKRNAKTQAKLVQDLVDLSRLRSGKLELNREVVSVLNCVSSAVDTVRQEATTKNIATPVRLALKAAWESDSQW